MESTEGLTPPEGMVTFREYAEMVGKAEEWLWESFIGSGLLTLLAASPKVGKSTAIGHLLKAILTGEDFWGKPTEIPPAILLFSEEGPVLMKRMEELGVMELAEGPPTWVNGGHPTWWGIIEILDQAPEGSLIILDTGSRYWPVEDENNAGHVNQALGPLLEVMKRLRLAVVFVHHMNKGTATAKKGDPMDGVRGSSALTGSADIILMMQKVSGGSGTRRRITIGGRLKQGEMTVELVDGRYIVLSSSLGDLADALGAEGSAGEKNGKAERRPLTRVEEAGEMLRAILRDGPMPAKEAEERMNAEKFSKSTTKRAKALVGVRSRKVSDGWVWVSPEEVQEEQEGQGSGTLGDAVK